MKARKGHTEGRRPSRLAAMLLALAVAPAAFAQERPAPGGDAPPPFTQPSPAQQQETIRERVQKLENRLLMLGRLLAESEPDKAERLRTALDQSGRRQVKRRLAQVVRLLRAEQFSDAEREQEALLADLQAMLTVLTDTAGDLERRRAERQRLQRLRQAIRALADEQLEQLYRTRAAASEPSPAHQAARREALEEIERQQRALEHRAADLAEEMKAPHQTPETPGRRQIGRARQHMQRAADRLAEPAPDDAQTEQQAALEQLQRALDQLDDTLRQVRREELEETLSALETRFKSMLTRERRVGTDVGALQAKGAAAWNRSDELRLAEAAQTQQGVAEDCATVVRILISEGTTVVLPDLARQLADDMAQVAGLLDRADTSPATQTLLEQIIDVLEEIVAAVETRRRAEQEAAAQPGAPGAAGGSRPLLPGSAELKLLRWSQLRINRRTAALAQGADGVPAPQRQQTLNRLAERQRRIAELARRMNERR